MGHSGAHLARIRINEGFADVSEFDFNHEGLLLE